MKHKPLHTHAKTRDPLDNIEVPNHVLVSLEPVDVNPNHWMDIHDISAVVMHSEIRQPGLT